MLVAAARPLPPTERTPPPAERPLPLAGRGSLHVLQHVQVPAFRFARQGKLHVHPHMQVPAFRSPATLPAPPRVPVADPAQPHAAVHLRRPHPRTPDHRRALRRDVLECIADHVSLVRNLILLCVVV